jgi:hypothetical protein
VVLLSVRRLLSVVALAAVTAAPALAKDATTTSLTTSAASIVEGSSGTLTAKVTRTGASGIPTGTVTFYYETYSLGTATLVNGTGSVTASADVPAGVYGLTASYSGDANDAASVSAVENVTVQSVTTTTFSLSPTDVQVGQPAVVMAKVARNGNTGYATGTVEFLLGGNVLASGTLSDGATTVQVSTTGAPLGAYKIYATYEGDTLNAASTSATQTATVTPAVDVLTFRNDVSRTGLQPAETVLTPANVNATNFGKVFTFTTDGYTYAQPLFVSNYTMSDGKSHNVLFIANETGTMYAFDADNNNPSAGYLWKSSIVPTTEQVVAYADYYGCTNPYPNAGIIGTPTIDRALGVMYVIGKTKLVSGSTTTYIQRLHAISLASGAEALNGPTVIQATVPGTGDGGTTDTFNPLSQNERAAMVEANGSVWISWASHCDEKTYHGWTMGYNAANISQQTAVYNNTPNGSQGGIWMVSGGISADNEGNLYTVAGNGTFDANDGGLDYSDAAQRLAIGNNTLTSEDYFTPTNESYLSAHDLDFGTADALLFDDPASGVAPHLLVTADKTGRIYLMNRFDLGGFNTGSGSTNGDLQDFAYSSQNFTNFGFFQNRVYVGQGGEPLAAFDYTAGTADTVGHLATTPSMTTSVTFSASYSTGGLQPMFSANGTTNGIVWGLDTDAQVLYAFNASTLGTELYASSTNSTRDMPPSPVKFTVPVIANGRVYVAGQGTVAAYGILP